MTNNTMEIMEEKRKAMFKTVLECILRDIEATSDNADRKDVERSYYCAGGITAYIDILNKIGHNAEHGHYEDEGCMRLGYLNIDGIIYCRNGEIDYHAFANALNH